MKAKNFHLADYDFDLSEVKSLNEFGHACVQNWAERMKLMHQIKDYNSRKKPAMYSPDYLLVGMFQTLQDDYKGVEPVVFNLKDESKFAPIYVLEYDEQHLLITDGNRKEMQIKLKSEI